MKPCHGKLHFSSSNIITKTQQYTSITPKLLGANAQLHRGRDPKGALVSKMVGTQELRQKYKNQQAKKVRNTQVEAGKQSLDIGNRTRQTLKNKDKDWGLNTRQGWQQ